MPSVIMGVIALVILFVSKKIMPKFPMAVVLMFVGTIFHNKSSNKRLGIKTLNAVEPGLPKWSILISRLFNSADYYYQFVGGSSNG